MISDNMSSSGNSAGYYLPIAVVLQCFFGREGVKKKKHWSFALVCEQPDFLLFWLVIALASSKN